MILLIEVDNGEQYEDFHSWIELIYDVNTSKTSAELQNEWKKEVVKKMEEASIEINPHWLNIMETSKVKNKKLHKKILKENNFCSWIEKTYEVKEIKFETLHI